MWSIVRGARAVLGDVAEAVGRRRQDLDRLDTGVRRLVNPHRYHVSLTPALYALKQQLIDHYSR